MKSFSDKMQKTFYKLKEIDRVAQQIIAKTSSKILAFYAPMGAGKTTLIKALLKELGATDAGSSPTFGIVNEYHDDKGKLLAYHFDFYRLIDETEALDLGLEDYLNQDVWTFIEWPEKVLSYLPQNTMDIQIEIIDPKTRSIMIL